MYNNKKVVVVLPAYNASKTLEITYNEIPFNVVDEVVLVDDASKDDTASLAKKMGIKHVIRHEENRGYGGNQKSCYDKALELGGEIVIMLHPDCLSPLGLALSAGWGGMCGELLSSGHLDDNFTVPLGTALSALVWTSLIL